MHRMYESYIKQYNVGQVDHFSDMMQIKQVDFDLSKVHEDIALQAFIHYRAYTGDVLWSFTI